MPYVDGFVIPVPKANKDAYRAEAEKMWTVMRDYGAIEVWECWGEDIPEGEVTSFPSAVMLKDDETVVFSWVIWRDREARSAAQENMLKDPRMEEMEMPFDGKRLIFGSFIPLFTARG